MATVVAEVGLAAAAVVLAAVSVLTHRAKAVLIPATAVQTLVGVGAAATVTALATIAALVAITVALALVSANRVKAKARALVTALATLTTAASVVAHRVMPAMHVTIRNPHAISTPAKASKAVTRNVQHHAVHRSATLADVTTTALVEVPSTKTAVLPQRAKTLAHPLTVMTVLTAVLVRNTHPVHKATVTLALLKKLSLLKVVLAVTLKPINPKWFVS